MQDKIDEISTDLEITKTLASHLYQLITNDYAQLPRMEVYRLRRALNNDNCTIISAYGRGYFLLPDHRRFYQKMFKIS